MGLDQLDKNGDRKIDGVEVYNSLTKDERENPETIERVRRQFQEMDKNDRGDIDIDEYIAWWRKNVEPKLDA